MNIEIANALSGYLETLYEMNQRLIKLCGIDIFGRYGGEKDLLDIVDNIPRVLPYSYNNNKECLEFKKNDGLLEFKEDLEYLENAYTEILKDNYEFLCDVKMIRNGYEHKMHSIEHKSSGSNPTSHFMFQLEVKNGKETKSIEVKSDDFIKFVKPLNSLYSKMVKEINIYAKDNALSDSPYSKRLSRFDFEMFNLLYSSDLLKSIGRVMHEF